jgi:phosphoglycolate phosphatase
MRPRYALLVFDWDGTLVDSEARIAGCLRQALTSVGIEPPAPTRLRKVIGLAMPQVADALLDGADEATAARFIAAFRDAWWCTEAEAAQPFHGIVETLRDLAGRHRLAVATNKSRRGLDLELRSTGLGDLLCASRCADEARGKPDPQMLHDLLRETGVPPDAALVIGDTAFDLQMAAAAGVAAVAVECGMHDREHLLGHGPLACLPSVAALPAWLTAGARM